MSCTAAAAATACAVESAPGAAGAALNVESFGALAAAKDGVEFPAAIVPWFVAASLGMAATVSAADTVGSRTAFEDAGVAPGRMLSACGIVGAEAGGVVASTVATTGGAAAGASAGTGGATGRLPNVKFVVASPPLAGGLDAAAAALDADPGTLPAAPLTMAAGSATTAAGTAVFAGGGGVDASGG